MLGYVLLFDDAGEAARVSREIYVDDCFGKGNRPDPSPANMFGICENVLGGEIGLHVPPKVWLNLQDRYKAAYVHKTPLWVNQAFISGKPMFFIGNGPFGFGVGVNDPAQTRKILEGNYAKPLLNEVRKRCPQNERAAHAIRHTRGSPRRGLRWSRLRSSQTYVRTRDRSCRPWCPKML